MRPAFSSEQSSEDVSGAWWARKLAQKDQNTFKVETEEEARKAAGLPGVEWTYLRFARQGDLSPPGGEGKGEGRV